ELFIPMGGFAGQEMRRLLRAEELGFKSQRIQRETRTNILITPRRGPQYRFNSPGPQWSATEYRQAGKMASGVWRSCKFQILSGSLPRKASPKVYARQAPGENLKFARPPHRSEEHTSEIQTH